MSIRVLAGRLAAALIGLLLLAVMTFSLIRVLPGSVEDALLGTESATTEARTALRAKYGLDEPLPVQFATWITNVVQGDLGTSPRTRQPVAGRLVEKAWISIQLGGIAVLLSLVLAIVLGTFAGLHRGRVGDRIATSAALLGTSVPDFVIGLLLVLFIARNVAAIPTFGYVPLSNGFLNWAAHMVLPVATLALILIGVLTRLMRSSVAETMQSDHVRTARGKGLSRRRLILHHVVRPSLLTVIATVGVQLVAIVGGVVVVEVVFSIPGMGRLILDAIRNRDYVMVQGATLFIGAWAIFVSFGADLLHRLLDPRARH